jgi:hypothetical protein
MRLVYVYRSTTDALCSTWSISHDDTDTIYKDNRQQVRFRGRCIYMYNTQAYEAGDLTRIICIMHNVI